MRDKYLSFDHKIVITNLELSVPLKSALKSGKMCNLEDVSIQYLPQKLK